MNTILLPVITTNVKKIDTFLTRMKSEGKTPSQQTKTLIQLTSLLQQTLNYTAKAAVEQIVDEERMAMEMNQLKKEKEEAEKKMKEEHEEFLRMKVEYERMKQVEKEQKEKEEQMIRKQREMEKEMRLNQEQMEIEKQQQMNLLKIQLETKYNSDLKREIEKELKEQEKQLNQL